MSIAMTMTMSPSGSLAPSKLIAAEHSRFVQKLLQLPKAWEAQCRACRVRAKQPCASMQVETELKLHGHRTQPALSGKGLFCYRDPKAISAIHPGIGKGRRTLSKLKLGTGDLDEREGASKASTGRI